MDVYYPNVYNAYLANQGISAEELRKLFEKDDPKYEHVSVPMEFYSKENNLPEQKLADDLAEELRKEKGLPKGIYETTVYKNHIVNRVGLPDGENIDVEEIIK